MGVYTPEELKGVQKISLEMAVMFHEFCKRNNLLCYLCGGGCIGTIRHKGFIPWDDDLDFFMPRKDYEKFIEIWNEQKESERYTLVMPNKDVVIHHQFATLRDNQTTQVKPLQVQDDICHGVALDIIPLDGYGPTNWKRKWQCFWSLTYKIFCTQVIPEKHGAAMGKLAKVILAVVPSKKLRCKIWKLAEQKMSQYDIDDKNVDSITELCTGTQYMRNRYPKEWFASAVEKEFEGEMLPIPVGYDSYLRMVFGDYMQLPPKEKQVSHHDAVFLDLEHSCERYKGVYYCVKENRK